MLIMDFSDEKAFEIQICGSAGVYQWRTFEPRLQPERLARTFTLGWPDLSCATESGVKVVAQYVENVPFWGLPEGSESMAKPRMKWKSMPSWIGTGSNVTGTPVAPMYSIITFPSEKH